jgi:hypothetical protein
LFHFDISDTPKPQQGKSAPIQKGLVPHIPGKPIDICGEGLGFGTPILQYRRDFYFPGSATLHPQKENGKIHWTKVFTYNLIERWQRKSHHSIAAFSWARPRLHNLIYKTKTGRHLLKFIAIADHLSLQRSGIRLATPQFIPVQSRGQTPCHYRITENGQCLDIEMNFDAIVRSNLQSIYIANELGGHHFTRYFDSLGTQLEEYQIEPWTKINGQWAVFYAPYLDFGFRVEIPENANAFRGREVFKGSDIFWSGIILQLPNSTIKFSYQLQLGTLHQILKET